jgi:hypothetical protein
MSYRNGNYSAFYVAEPFNPSSLGAYATEDFCHYNLLKAWKGANSSFPFIDSHAKNYDVRDDSDWELTLKPRLRERLRKSKNIVLFLSGVTSNSRALREEINYGINDQSLPVLVIYPDYKTKQDIAENGKIKQNIKNLWDQLPIFRDSMNKVPTLHLPFEKKLIESGLSNEDFMLATKTKNSIFFF